MLRLEEMLARRGHCQKPLKPRMVEVSLEKKMEKAVIREENGRGVEARMSWRWLDENRVLKLDILVLRAQTVGRPCSIAALTSRLP